MDHSVSNLNLTFAVALLLLTGALAVLLLLSLRSRIAALTQVITGLALQSFHSLEHVIQINFWVNNPESPGFMSPYAKQAAAGLESLAQRVGIYGYSGLGMELLHLVGNAIFFLGALGLLLGAGFTTQQRRRAGVVVVFEGLHLLEHVILTGFVVAGRPAWGTSTLFATLSGAQLSTHRIWWHLIMNLAGLALFFWAFLARSKRTSDISWATALTLASAALIPALAARLRSTTSASGYGSAGDWGLVISAVTSPVMLIALFFALWAYLTPSRAAARRG